MKQPINTKLRIAGLGIGLLASLSFNACKQDDDGGSAAAPAIFDCATMGTIKTNTTFKKGAYNVTCDIDVRSGATLTIEPGTILIFDAGKIVEVEEGGIINANGTSSESITFKGKEPVKGYWAGVYVYSKSINNKFAYCNISDGGSASNGANIKIANSNSGATASIEYCKISNSRNAGVTVFTDKDVAHDANVLNSFHDNVLTGNGTYPLVVNTPAVTSIGEGNSYTGNAKDYINILSYYDEEVNVPVTFSKQAVPYLVSGTGGNGVLFYQPLTVQPGVTVVFSQGMGFGFDNSGTITAVGTASDKITFKGLENTKGYWSGLYVRTNSVNNKFNYCNLSDGGGNTDIPLSYSGSLKGIISTYGYNTSATRKLTINKCNISNSSSSGIYINAYTTVNSDVETDNTFSGCTPNVQR